MKTFLLLCLTVAVLGRRGRGPKCDDDSRPACSDGAKPSKVCSDGTVLEGGRGGRGSRVGRPKCADGAKPSHQCSDGGLPACGDGSLPSPCKDKSQPTCPGSTMVCSDGGAFQSGSFPPCTGGKPKCEDDTVKPTCADGQELGGKGGRPGRG